MKNKIFIEELYNSFLSKRKEAFQTVIDYEDEISSLDKFLDSVNISEDFKFFSPHSADMIFDADINSKKERKVALSLEIDKLNSMIDEYDHSLTELKEILQDEESKENIKENNTLANKEDNLDDISLLQHSLVSDLIDNKAFDILENERKRIAGDLHDTTVQNLVYLLHSIELASMFINQDPVRAKLELDICSKNLKETIEDIRNIIFNLRPMSFDDLSFKQCIDDYINNIKIHYPSVVFNYDVDELDNNVDLNIIVFRIIQECVNNSLRHSKSPDLFLSGKINYNSYEITVKDNGVGFDFDLKKDNHFGLRILQDRVNLINGKLDILSDSSGTQINIVFPL